MKHLAVFSILALLFSCATSSIKIVESNTLDTLTQNKLHSEALTILQKDIKPVLGYRFIIDGDFDGDGKQEQLIEHYYTLKTNKETNKFYDGLEDYGDMVTLAIDTDPFSFVLCDNKDIDTLYISSYGQLFGVSYLKNEGDLNGDGTDEISYVVDWADWSSLNTWHIATYKNKEWKRLYSFPIWDWQLPELPTSPSQYGLFGVAHKTMNEENDSMNALLEKDLHDFKGLVKKVARNKIQVTYRNEEASADSMVINLRHPPKRK